MKEEKSNKLQILRYLWGERPRTRTSEQSPARQMQLKQEVDGVDTGVGLQENRGRF